MIHIVYTRHAEDVMRERGLKFEWVKRTLASPDQDEPDPDEPTLRRAFKAIPERDGRVLRVVYGRTDDTLRVVTAFFDRDRRR
ncbi:DUF4258 domain-containing protein [Blastochloris tepida]|uniref:DUF4258 domain-containing protein n=1 Tax=Blastochloris tepida TaxID=2233851 RepID=A0A348FYT6_9HYPH|nr:DUF4258 domain-containing protein [Blastochloris tepida]BBF92469.1 hypothetical protein BLTE_11540 [Blastochloris tepida]